MIPVHPSLIRVKFFPHRWRFISIEALQLQFWHLYKYGRYWCSNHLMMFHFPSYAALLLSLLPALISAECAACDSYSSALHSCQSSSNVTAVGTAMDTSTIHCMCTSRSGVTDMDACQACIEADPLTTLLPSVLFAWTETCSADAQFGDKQAALCWGSQPSNFIPCVSKSGGSGSGSGSTNGGSGGSTTGTAAAGAPSPTSRYGSYTFC